MWNTLPLERFVEHCLKTKHKEKGDTLWGKYLTLRQNLTDNVLPWIQRNEPDLTDHGIDHIENVMANAGKLLGLPDEHGSEVDWDLPPSFNAHEMLLILLGCLTHDLGNLLGRKSHNQNIGKVAELAGPGWSQWNVQERKVIEAIGRAHTGKSTTGSKDTLQALATQPGFFSSVKVRLGEVASVVRFADELAEGPQRTSSAILALTADADAEERFKFAASSNPYHLYAEITTLDIDYHAGRILINFDIDRTNSKYASDSGGKREVIRSLLQMAYQRSLKLNAERQYARHYSEALSRFRETSINLAFTDAGHPIEGLDRTVVISDALTAFELGLELEKLNEKFSIDKILGELMPEEKENAS